MPSQSFVSRSLSSRLLCAALLGVGVAASSASCGSRTGLLVPDALVADSAAADASRDAAIDGPLPCVPGVFDLELATAQLMFVLDRSGSMAFALGGGDPIALGEPSRWDILHDALRQTMLPFDQQLAMGAKFYPEALSASDLGNPDLACRTATGVGIPPARGNANAILDVFDTTQPRGGTPTSEAIRLAASDLAERRTVARTIVVATDGAPNCNADLDTLGCTCTTPSNSCADNPEGCLDDNRTVLAIRNVAETMKIPVFVIGIGSTERPEFLQVLDAMAVAGGRPRPTAPRHYNVQSPAELRTALATIRDSIASCTYLTPSSPTDPNAITVEVGGTTIARDPSHKNGWDWVDQAYGSLAFFGPACRAAQTSGQRIDGKVSCTNP